MAYYVVRARPKGNMPSLKLSLDSGEIAGMKPFGKALAYGLNNARQDGEWMTWEEEDYCVPPLAQERAAVLDRYFADLNVRTVRQGEGWKQLQSLPRVWK